jgi:tetratricopeptide (TPR) repeat protein
MIRGEIAERRGDTEEALKQYEYVERLEPDHVSAYNEACYLRALLKQDLETHALADCNKALALSKDNPHILDSRGYLYLVLGRNDDAIADYNSALAANPKLGMSLYGRGLAERRKGDDVDAEKDITAAQALLPGVETKFGTLAVFTLRPAAAK